MSPGSPSTSMAASCGTELLEPASFSPSPASRPWSRSPSGSMAIRAWSMCQIASRPSGARPRPAIKARSARQCRASCRPLWSRSRRTGNQGRRCAARDRSDEEGDRAHVDRAGTSGRFAAAYRLFLDDLRDGTGHGVAFADAARILQLLDDGVPGMHGRLPHPETRAYPTTDRVRPRVRVYRLSSSFRRVPAPWAPGRARSVLTQSSRFRGGRRRCPARLPGDHVANISQEIL